MDGVGRYFERYCDDVVSPMLGLRIGAAAPPWPSRSASPRSVTIENPAIMEWTGYDTELRGLPGRSASAASANDPLERIRQLSRQTVSLADRIHAAQRIASRARLPAVPSLAVAPADRPDDRRRALPTRVFYVSITGFDTHVEQLRGHRGILQELKPGGPARSRARHAGGPDSGTAPW